MAKDIVFPSVTEIYGALITPTGPRAYVPRLHKAIQKLMDHPDKESLERAKKVTKNPIIQKAIDAIYNASKSYTHEDTVTDIQYGIIATLADKEYTQLPWLVDKIQDPEIQYQALNAYRIKYTRPEYAYQYSNQPINQSSSIDYLSKCIIEIYLALAMHPKTPVDRKDWSHHAIYQISNEFAELIQSNTYVKKEFISSYKEIFDRIENEINRELKTSQVFYDRASEYATMAIRLTNFIPNKAESKHLQDHFVKLEQKCTFPNLFQDDKKSDKGTKKTTHKKTGYDWRDAEEIELEDPEKQQKTKKRHDWRDTEEIELDAPEEQPDAYDRLKQKFGSAIKRVKKKTDEISDKPGVKKARKQAGDALESAARATVNAIDAGIEKIKQKATRENFESAITLIKNKWDKFMAEIDAQKRKK